MQAIAHTKLLTNTSKRDLRRNIHQKHRRCCNYEGEIYRRTTINLHLNYFLASIFVPFEKNIAITIVINTEILEKDTFEKNFCLVLKKEESQIFTAKHCDIMLVHSKDRGAKQSPYLSIYSF